MTKDDFNLWRKRSDLPHLPSLRKASCQTEVILPEREVVFFFPLSFCLSCATLVYLYLEDEFMVLFNLRSPDRSLSSDEEDIKIKTGAGREIQQGFDFPFQLSSMRTTHAIHSFPSATTGSTLLQRKRYGELCLAGT